MSKKNQKLQNCLRKYRKENGLTQKQAAFLLGHKTTSAISSYEKGNKLPSLENAIKLSLIYRTLIDALYTEHREKLIAEIQVRRGKLV